MNEEHTHRLRPGQSISLEYTVCVEAFNHGRPLDKEQTALIQQRDELVARAVRRIREFYDAVDLVEGDR